jgi:hypothetical protein
MDMWICMDIAYFVLIHQLMSIWVIFTFGYYEKYCYELLCITFCRGIVFDSLRSTHRSEIIISHLVTVHL